jgi:hypothetical protein
MAQEPTLGGNHVYVSAFITNHAIPERPEAAGTLFTLRGAGYGYWETAGDAVELAAADLFVMVTWVNAPRGA